MLNKWKSPSIYRKYFALLQIQRSPIICQFVKVVVNLSNCHMLHQLIWFQFLRAGANFAQLFQHVLYFLQSLYASCWKVGFGCWLFNNVPIMQKFNFIYLQCELVQKRAFLDHASQWAEILAIMYFNRWKVSWVSMVGEVWIIYVRCGRWRWIIINFL